MLQQVLVVRLTSVQNRANVRGVHIRAQVQRQVALVVGIEQQHPLASLGQGRRDRQRR